MKNRTFLSLILVSTFFISVPSASAHTVLIASDPEANSTIAQLPEQVTLTFAEPLIVIGKKSINTIRVVDPMGSTISTSTYTVKGATLSNVLSPSMVMPGKFHVFFRVVAQDGHLVTGDFYFSIGKPQAAHTSRPVPSGIFHLTALGTSAGMSDAHVKSDLHATMKLDLDFTGKRICYSISSNVKDAVAIHVHSMNQMNMTMSDEIFIPLQLRSINSKVPVCDSESLAAMAMIYYNVNHYSFVIHTKKYPDGALAGILKLNKK